MIKITPTVQNLRKAINECLPKLETLLEQRQDYFDKRSESWLESEKADEYQEDTDNLEILITVLTEAETALEDTFD